MLRDSTVAAVVRTRPRAIPLPLTTMRKSVHGFRFPYMVMGLRLAALRAAGAPLLINTRGVLLHEHNNLACWIINLLLDVLLCGIAENFYSLFVF